jgi:predicted hydrolase (HD superfamily)
VLLGLHNGHMSLTRDEAWAHLSEWTETDSLRTHARAVELVMRAAATEYGESEDVEVWGVTGMLHDADYEKWPDTHPDLIVAWLRERDENPMAHAISAHFTQWGVAYETLLDRALVACDELTGFVMACAKIRPEGVMTLTAKSVKKRLKSKSFAAKVDREEVRKGAELLEVDLAQHIEFVIGALREHAEELGIAEGMQ